MPFELDLKGAVEGLIRNYGVNAADEAKRMSGRLSHRKDQAGADFWHRVHKVLTPTKLEATTESGVSISRSKSCDFA
jgi:hypothetical protein